MIDKLKNKKWWKLILPIVIVIKVVVVVMALSSLKSDNQANADDSETIYTAVKIPDKLSFAGEKMPLDQFDVKEALDRELLSNSYFHSQTIRFIKLAPRYFPVIEPILKEKGIPDDFKYLAIAESGLNPRAVSAAGAVGFWQFLDVTAKEYGLEVNKEVDERYHVEKSTYAFCAYLRVSYNKYGSWTLAAASYNGGMARVQKQMARQKMYNYYDLLFAEETQRYVFRIAALKLILENPKQYNFDVEDDEKYPFIKTREVEINGQINDFADFAIANGINYKLLKDFNPWLRDDKLTNSAGKKYTVKIPVLK
ncbi:MAG TPA: lytic transglycosylase domain-containing protein [Draconibacterium sp.]|nr:lytic transglycosylase domain-containing protein [Draconibacterium sp.]